MFLLQEKDDWANCLWKKEGLGLSSKTSVVLYNNKRNLQSQFN